MDRDGVRSFAESFAERLGNVVHHVATDAVTHAEQLLTVEVNLRGPTIGDDYCAGCNLPAVELNRFPEVNIAAGPRRADPMLLFVPERRRTRLPGALIETRAGPIARWFFGQVAPGRAKSSILRSAGQNLSGVRRRGWG